MTGRAGGALRNRSWDAIFLCYHSINESGPVYLTVSPADFERQLATLSRLGYTAGTPEALRVLASGGRTGARHAFVTFDDGFADNHEHAMPILRRHGFTGWVFVLPPRVNSGAALDWPEVQQAALTWPRTMRSCTWSQLEQMAEAGFEIGSHGLSHAHLTRLGDDALREELLESKRAIEARLGRCDSLAYPFGEWDARVAAAAADVGYSFAFTMPSGAQREATALSIPRVAVDLRDGGVRFRAKVRPLTRRLLLSRAKPALRRLRMRPRRRGR